MPLEEIARVDRATWKKYLFYIDLVMFLVFAVSLTLLVRHTYLAGYLYASEIHQATQAIWMVVIDTVFLVGSLSWISYRFFRNLYLVLTRRF